MLKRITGIIFTTLGLLIALGPQFLFKVCEPMGENFMKCYWSARAEIGVGAVIAILGIALIVFTCAKIRLGLVIGILLSGINALLIPHALIGGCPMDTMPCRKIAFPAITVISILVLIEAGVYTAYLALRRARISS
jgi:hypothetical protein